MTGLTEREFLVLSLLMTMVYEDNIGSFDFVEEMREPFIDSDDIESALTVLDSKGLAIFVVVTPMDEPGAVSIEPKISLTVRGVGFCLANEADVLRAALGGSTEHIVAVRQAFDRIRDQQGISLESSVWTGMTARLGKEKIVRIQSGVRVLLDVIEQAELDETEKQNALAYAQAVDELVNAPDPAWKQIVELLNSQPLSAFLNVTSLLTIILSVTS